MISVLKNKNNISIKGHALYDDLGKDIVCSAVSSIVITTVNGILAINEKAIIFKSTQSGIEIEIKESDDVTLKLINNMLELLEKLSQDYPKNIQIREGVKI